jgi:hypothetical protein
MPNDNSQMNSGIVATPGSVDPRSMTSNMTAIPDRRDRLFCPGERQDHLPLNLPRPYIGAPDRRAALPLCTRSVSPIDGSIGQMQSRSTAPSRLAWQNRVAIASWDSRVCPHASHTLIGASPCPCSGPGDWISNSVVIMVT